MQSRIAHNLSGLVLPQFYFYNKIVVLLKHIYEPIYFGTIIFFFFHDNNLITNEHITNFTHLFISTSMDLYIYIYTHTLYFMF